MPKNEPLLIDQKNPRPDVRKLFKEITNPNIIGKHTWTKSVDHLYRTFCEAFDLSKDELGVITDEERLETRRSNIFAFMTAINELGGDRFKSHRLRCCWKDTNKTTLHLIAYNYETTQTVFERVNTLFESHPNYDYTGTNTATQNMTVQQYNTYRDQTIQDKLPETDDLKITTKPY